MTSHRTTPAFSIPPAITREMIGAPLGPELAEKMRAAVPLLTNIRDELDQIHRRLHTIADNFAVLGSRVPRAA